MDEATNITAEQRVDARQNGRISRLVLLMETFGLSLGEVARASGRTISKTQFHRILLGRKHPTASERQAIAKGVLAILRSRCQDSAFLFGDEA